jgi:hypothetical protein
MISEASNTTQTQRMEQRIQALENVVSELQAELAILKSPLSSGSQQRLLKMRNYQQELDQMFGLKSP